MCIILMLQAGKQVGLKFHTCNPFFHLRVCDPAQLPYLVSLWLQVHSDDLLYESGDEEQASESVGGLLADDDDGEGEDIGS